MKKIYLILIAFTLFTCSSDDSEFKKDSLFNPPNWIQGTWIGDTSSIFESTIEFVFTSDNIKQEIRHLDDDNVEHINYYDDYKSVYSDKVDFITEEITNQIYSYILPQDPLYSPNYESLHLFKKISSNELILFLPTTKTSSQEILLFKQN